MGGRSVEVYGEMPASVVLTGHRKRLLDCAISPDRRFLVSASVDGTVGIWDPVTGDCTHTIRLKAGGPCVVIPDGTIAVAAVETISLFRPDGTEPLRVLEGHRKPVTRLRAAPDGSYLLSASLDGSVRMWDPATGHLIRALSHTKAVSDCDVAPDGSFIVSVSNDRALRIWDPATGKSEVSDSISVKKVGGGNLVRCGILPDGRIMVSCVPFGGTVVWDPETGRNTLEGLDDAGLAVTPAGEMLLMSDVRGGLGVRSAATGDLRLVLTGHTKQVLGASVSQDGLIAATTSRDRSVRIWPIGVGVLGELMAAVEAAVPSTGAVEVVLGIHTHDPDVAIEMPSGDRLREIAAESLARHDSTRSLHADGYVRAILASGGGPLPAAEGQALRDAPALMKGVLEERGVDPHQYSIDVWSEPVGDRVRVVWAAATRR